MTDRAKLAGYITRFAPSPTGPLHLGHAYSALTAHDRAKRLGGRFLLRIEDIDPARSRPQWEEAVYEDLAWLGLTWEQPVLRQSQRLPQYQTALQRLKDMGLLYPCRCSRGDIRAALSAPQEGAPLSGPDGLIYPGLCRHRPLPEASPDEAWRLDMAKATALTGNLTVVENGPSAKGIHSFSAQHMTQHIGDVVLARRDFGTSYHLSVVLDDAAQGVTEPVRGLDLFEATPIHVLLQRLLDLPQTEFYHHDLVRDEAGKRLAKRDDARALSRYRDEGATPADIRAMLHL